MSILREEIRDFKLLKHITLLVTDRTNIAGISLIPHSILAAVQVEYGGTMAFLL